MSSAQKKLDEKNLKILRELLSLPPNKYCFDCNQRGPTYVNVTIGSFICTKCSGMLRGLTPPHRVKSISMASFTEDEIKLLSNRGNEYCRNVWLGLLEKDKGRDFNDEQSIKEFMAEKYEKKRFYLEPSSTVKIPSNNNNNNNNKSSLNVENKSKSTSAIPRMKLVELNGNVGRKSFPRQQPQQVFNTVSEEFKADFSSASIYNAVDTEKDRPTVDQTSFFFNNSNNNNNNIPQTKVVDWKSSFANANFPVELPAPSEDRYAALKDLDMAFKSQFNNTINWDNVETNDSSLRNNSSSSLNQFSSSKNSLPFGTFVSSDSSTERTSNGGFNPFGTDLKAKSNPNPFEEDLFKANVVSNQTVTDYNLVINQKMRANPFLVQSSPMNNPFL